jgi:hypothetical protein
MVSSVPLATSTVHESSHEKTPAHTTTARVVPLQTTEKSSITTPATTRTTASLLSSIQVVSTSKSTEKVQTTKGGLNPSTFGVSTVQQTVSGGTSKSAFTYIPRTTKAATSAVPSTWGISKEQSTPKASSTAPVTFTNTQHMTKGDKMFSTLVLSTAQSAVKNSSTVRPITADTALTTKYSTNVYPLRGNTSTVLNTLRVSSTALPVTTSFKNTVKGGLDSSTASISLTPSSLKASSVAPPISTSSQRTTGSIKLITASATTGGETNISRAVSTSEVNMSHPTTSVLFVTSDFLGFTYGEYSQTGETLRIKIQEQDHSSLFKQFQGHY